MGKRARFHLVIAVAVAAIVVVAPASAMPYTFGSSDMTISTVIDNLTANVKGVNVMTSPKAGTITKVEGYMDGKGAASGSEKVRIVVYDIDANNNPTTLRGVSSELTISANAAAAWKTFTFPSSVTVPAGKVGIGYWAGGGTSNLARPYYDTSTSTCVLKYNNNTYSSTGNPSNPFGTPNCGGQNRPWAIRVTADDGTLVYNLSEPRYGISPGYLINNRTPAMQDFEIDQAVRTGVKLYRLDYLAHSASEVAKNQAVIEKAQGRGLEIDLVMGGTEHSGWSTTATTYGQECSDAATRYHNTIRYYEVLNEPNGSWNGPWNATTYVSYLQACYNAVKAVDSRNIVLLGGIAPAATTAPVTWVQALYSAGAKPYFDRMNLHLYGDPAETATWSIWQQTFGPNVNPNVASVMASNGDSAKKIVSTEGGEQVGSSSCSGGCTEQQQSDFIQRNLADSRPFQSYIYTILDDETTGFGVEIADPAGTIVDPTGTHWRRRPGYEQIRLAAGGTG
jgi:hypothetical protein